MAASSRDLLTPDALSMLLAIEETGSFAAAARQRGLVPSALTYRIRQIEDALDVLLFDRSSRQAKPTEAGKELLREAKRLLQDVDALANRVKRVATGWESVLTVAVDSIISRSVVMEICDAFLALNPPTRMRIRYETLSGTLATLKSGQADLAIGVFLTASSQPEFLHESLGQISFVYAVAPHHPLAMAPEPLSDAIIQQHRAVAVADSVPRGEGVTIGLLGGQDVLTVPDMPTKLEAQLRGLGGGFLPESMAKPYVESGRLVAKKVSRIQRISQVEFAWRNPHGKSLGHALSWWLSQLSQDRTKQALLQPHHRV
ncbi:MAG: LysR family transcriptional regulator [Burkholderiales bacterium]|nr:LysR family transcriptional regulator [Burkholderiales bacterium]